MPTTIKGLYENGKIRLLEKPPKRIGKIGVYIQFVQIPSFVSKPKSTGSNKNKFDLEKFKKVVKETFGAVPDLPDGISYEDKMREKSNWERGHDW